MSTSTAHSELPPSVRRVLDGVRRRIRAYVWVEGLALVVVTLGVAFWLGLGLDWSFELPSSVRQAAMVGVTAAVAWIGYRYLLRRALVPIADSSAALLLERRFPALGEHVLTAVDVASSPDRAAGFDPQMVEQTNQAAAHAVANVEPSKLFNRGPIVRAVGAAIGLAVSIVLFALLASDAFGFWLQRLALSEQPWPRRVQLEVVGFPPDANGVRAQKLAQDDDYELLVRARTDGHEVPESVEIRYTLADGRRGRDTMIRVGEAQPGRDKFQLFRYEFKRVAGDMTFDVVGGDDRVRDLTLRVVDRPELYAIELECDYPDYLAREPRLLPVTGGMRVPEGSRLVLHASATKPLMSARIHRSQNHANTDLTFDGKPADKLQWKYGTLSTDDVLFVSVTDEDDVAAREPYRISITAVPDEVPQVAVRLAGIGTAVTPDATIPFAGQVTDDYGLDAAWFEYQVDMEPKRVRPLAVQPAGRQTLQELGSFDLRGSDERGGPRTLTLQPGSKLTLMLQASDRNDLSDEVRAGSSQPFSLDIVTPGQLLALIERRELALRQRYQAIYDKVTDTRNLLGRVEFGEAAGGDADNRDATTADEEVDAAPAAAAHREIARRRLRVAGALQNVVQSGEEVVGVAEAFDDLHDQLVNNRIGNQDLKSRLKEQIAEPLHRIGRARMPQLAAQVKLVEEHVNDAPAGQAELTQSLKLADAILVEMRQVLDRMKELENYNEAVALLRGIITDQEQINRQTKERQRERFNTLLED
jgi:hypothetical protein